MPPTVISIDPISRLEGHLKIQVAADYVNGVMQVTEAYATGTMFRGFEQILQGRNPLDAPDITMRICGVCPVSHGVAATKALESAAGMIIPENARIMRNLILGANFIQSHILHFYHLALLDFVEGPAMAPWQPCWTQDLRISGADAAGLVNNYVAALDMRRLAHQAGALFGGRMPHPPSFVAGGITTTPRPARISAYETYIAQLNSFITSTYLPDVAKVASYYSDYYAIGQGYKNLLAYGVFDLDSTSGTKLLKGGEIANGNKTVTPLNVNSITEQVARSWYSDTVTSRNPSAGVTSPVYPKANGYSWLKAPRYLNAPFETGPLARMWMSGFYRNGISVMDRHMARAQEASEVGTALATWVTQLNSVGEVYTRYTTPATAASYGLTEAPRGALGHWVNIANGSISNYQIITPTCWNASPRDAYSRRGPLEQALIGTPVQNLQMPIEVLRVIHSFDPCMSCAVHVSRPGEDAKVYAVGGPGAAA